MAKNTQTTAEAIEKIKQQEEYGKYVKKMTPVHSLPKNMARAFLSGGIICTIGQGIMNICKSQGLDAQTSGSWTSLLLVLFSVILTGFNIYPRLAKWGGAGTLVPITGFANSVAAPAIEYQKEDRYRHWDVKFYHCRAGDSVWNFDFSTDGADLLYA